MSSVTILVGFLNGKDAVIYKNKVAIGKYSYLFDLNSASDAKIAENSYGITSKQWSTMIEKSLNKETEATTSDQLAGFASAYCCEVEDDPLMRQIILDSGDGELAYRYYRYVKADIDMYEVVASKSPERLADIQSIKNNDFEWV